MQNKSYKNIHYKEVVLSETFPISYIHHVQGYEDGNFLHFHNGVELGYCIRGNGVFFIENQSYTFSAGDVSLIFSDQPHIAQSPKDTKSEWYFLIVDSEALCRLLGYSVPILKNQAQENPLLPNFMRKEKYPEISVCTKKIFTELVEEKPNYQMLVSHQMLCLFLEVLRYKEDRPQTQRTAADTDRYSRIVPAIHYIWNHYTEKINIADLAQSCNLSNAQFLRVFKSVMNYTPGDYLMGIRMRMARNLLISEEISVLDVACRCGFDTISTFNRGFQQFYQMTPTQYRKSHRKKVLDI